MSSKKQQNQEYTESRIEKLAPREHIRRRPGMYIGGVDKRTLHNLMDIPLDYAIERVLNDKASKITIILMKDRTVQIQVDDTDMSVKIYSMGRSELELVMTEIGIGWHPRDGYFCVSGGLHGIGLSALTALSSKCIVEIKYDGYVWQQSYEKGLPVAEPENLRSMSENESRSTSFTFTPDFTIFDDNDFDFDIITSRCRDLAYLMPKLTVTVQDKREIEREEQYHFPNGLATWVSEQSHGHKTLHDVILVEHIHQLEDKRGGHYDVKVNLAFQYLDADNIVLRSFANMIETPDGGTHLEGLRSAIMKHIWQRDAHNYWDGFIGIVSIFHPDPQFESKTYARLLNPEVEEAVVEAVRIAFAQNPEAMAIIREKINT
jgi:DNA gyrase subunit B